jgi:phospholipase C
MPRMSVGVLSAALILEVLFGSRPSYAQSDLDRVNHIIIVMQENHSFDNYFGALPYVPGGAYHAPDPLDHDADGGCRADDHRCVDGLTCRMTSSGALRCLNSNPDVNGARVFAFHNPSRCVLPDLDHGWVGTHHEANFLQPNDALDHFLGDGFVRQNDLSEQIDTGPETPTDDPTMGFYNQEDLAFYYALAQNFALSDRHFSSVLSPTFPNRSYAMAATSFGHVTTNDEIPPVGGYKPIHGTIFDLMDKNNVSWADYFQDVPQGGSFRPFSATSVDPHFLPYALFLSQVSGVPTAGPLPEVAFVDPNFGFFTNQSETDEHPPTDIQCGQAFLSQVVNAVRNGPYWKDSIIFITYDEHGGFYDHAPPPRAPEGETRTPDDIAPGQCADLSNPPASLQPGGGAQCSTNQVNPPGSSVVTAEELCPALTANPTGPFPEQCASFDQLGFRVPFMTISAFAKPHYVSHAVSDHTSVLALIEKRFMTAPAVAAGDAGDARPHLTRRNLDADTLEDMFDFEHSPSLNTTVGIALPPTNDCTPAR